MKIHGSAQGARSPSLRWAYVLICALTLEQPTAYGYEASARLTDLQALEHAAEKNYPALKASYYAVAAAQAKLDEVTWSPFFQFQITGSVTMAPEVRGNPIFSDDSQLPLSNPWQPVARIGVDGALPLWTFGKLSAAKDAARAGIDAARADRKRSWNQVRYDLHRAYYTNALAIELKLMLEEGLSKLKKAIDQLKKQLEEGNIDFDEMDLYRLESAFSELEARESEARRLAETSREVLLILTALKEVRLADCPLEPLPFELHPLDWYVDLAFANRAEWKMLRAGVQARQAQEDAVEATYFPDLALALTASKSYGPGVTNQTNPFIIDQANYTSLSAGLVAKWSLDAPGIYAKNRQADANLSQAKAQLSEVRVGLRVEVAKVYNEATDAQRRTQTWASGRQKNKAWYIAASQAYDLGTLEPKDLVDSIRGYFTARANHIEAIGSFNMAVVALEKAVGIPLVSMKQRASTCSPE